MISCSECLDTLVRGNKDLQYHKECYKNSTNKTNIKRSKQSYEKTLALGNLRNVANSQDAQKKNKKKTNVRRKTLLEKNIEVPSNYIQKMLVHNMSRRKRENP